MSEIRDKRPPDRREEERLRLAALRERQPLNDESTGPGVLLSDVIRHYCLWFELISPFDEANLKPANYKLTIGDEYAIGGEIYPLPDSSGNNEVRIPPFAVAIIKTKETINMPPFLIGRWNIQVRRAYQGLVWVGGPQVDAGYVGHLFCPIYNLSDKDVVLRRGDPIAVIDFEKTTRFREGKCIRYPKVPENVLFEEYNPKGLISGLVNKAQKRLDQVEGRLESGIENAEGQIRRISQRADNFISLTFGVMAILFAAISVIAVGKESPPWPYISVFVLSGSAIFLSASAWLKSRSDGWVFGRSLQVVIVGGLLLAFLVQIFWIQGQQKQINQLSRQVLDLKTGQTDSAVHPSDIAPPASNKAAPSKTSK